MTAPRTGDLVMFQGRSLSSRVVDCLTSSKWSHAAIVWCNPPSRAPGTYLLMSSIETDGFGVQLQPLETYIYSYPCSVTSYSPVANPELLERQLPDLYASTKEAGYDLYPSDLLRAIEGRGCGCRSRETDSFVCSTYVAYLYEKLGLIRPATDWTTVRPVDLVEPTGRVQWNCGFSAPTQLR